MAENITPAESSLTTKIFRYWLPVLFMIGAMYYASTDVFSGDNTRGIIERIVLWLRPHTGIHGLTKINYIIRKMAHFVEYAVLAGLLFRAFRADSMMRWRLRWAACSFALAASWSLLDELHQSFTRTRGGSVYDSMLDSSGALFMLIAIAFFTRRRSFRPKNTDFFKQP